VEAKTSSRLLPRGVFNPTTVLGATYVAAALLGATTTAEVFVPYFMQVLHGLTPLAAGYAAALMAAGWTIGSIATASFAGRRAGLTDPGGVVGAASAAAWLFRSFTLLPLVAAVVMGIQMAHARQRPTIAPSAGDAAFELE